MVSDAHLFRSSPIILRPGQSLNGLNLYESTQLNFLSLTLFIHTVGIDLLIRNWLETSKKPAKCKGVFKTSVSESQTRDFQV